MKSQPTWWATPSRGTSTIVECRETEGQNTGHGARSRMASALQRRRSGGLSRNDRRNAVRGRAQRPEDQGSDVAQSVDGRRRSDRRHAQGSPGRRRRGLRQTTIRPESEPVLQEIADALAKNPNWKLSVEGHTDNIGGTAPNLDLSTRRAAAVRQALVDRYHVASGRLTPAGFGASRPKEGTYIHDSLESQNGTTA